MSLAAASGLGAATCSRAKAAGVDASHAARPVYLVVYSAGPAWKPGTLLRELPLRDHGRFMLSLHQRSLLRLAGAFADGSGGAAVFEADNDDEARALIDRDPAVTARLFTYSLRRWALVDWEKAAALRQNSSPGSGL